jgi:small subunit ribosomal protein S6
METIFNKLSGIISDLGGEISDFKNLGQKTFEYAVDKKYLSGEYLQISFEADARAPASIREKLRLDKTINRVFIESC